MTDASKTETGVGTKLFQLNNHSSIHTTEYLPFLKLI